MLVILVRFALHLLEQTLHFDTSGFHIRGEDELRWLFLLFVVHVLDEDIHMGQLLHPVIELDGLD